jgi:hypothetical protein
MTGIFLLGKLQRTEYGTKSYDQKTFRKTVFDDTSVLFTVYLQQLLK